MAGEKEFAVIEGAISVKAVLECGTREMNAVYISNAKQSRDTGYILALAREKEISAEIVPPEFFSVRNLGKSHGGIIAEVGSRIYEQPDTLLDEKNPFIVLLEGIEDPFNFGCAVRSLYAAGATGLVLPERNWMSAAGTVIKASAGASERIRCV